MLSGSVIVTVVFLAPLSRVPQANATEAEEGRGKYSPVALCTATLK
jgi:hypothetical protein